MQSNAILSRHLPPAKTHPDLSRFYLPCDHCAWRQVDKGPVPRSDPFLCHCLWSWPSFSSSNPSHPLRYASPDPLCVHCVCGSACL